MYTQMNRCSAHKIDNCSWLFHLSPFAILDCFYFKISICNFKTLCGILIKLIIILIRYVSKKPGYNAFWHLCLVILYIGLLVFPELANFFFHFCQRMITIFLASDVLWPADDIFRQFGPRSGLTRCSTRSAFWHFDVKKAWNTSYLPKRHRQKEQTQTRLLL